MQREELGRRIDQALGREPADLVIRDARVLNTANGRIEAGDVAVCGDTIVSVGEGLAGKRTIDARGRIAVPGFVDAHVHVESSMVVPAEFERAVLPRGTTTAICDPHEIANVLGAAGIRYFLEASEHLAMTLKVGLSSCVPATTLETAGAELEAEDLLALADHLAVFGLAELMNFPGVLAKDEGLLAKLEAFSGRHVDGHAPLVRGRSLDAYLSAGARTDHECTTAAEAREKLAKGMIVLLREGSVAKNVTALAPILNDLTWMRTAFCTDDRNPLEIAEEGHVDCAIRKAIAAGAPPVAAYRAATLGAALAFGLADRGIIAPGRRADIVLLDDLERVAVSDVVCGGRLVAADLFEGRRRPAPVGLSSVRRARVDPGELAVPGRSGATPVIGVVPFSLLTERLEAMLPNVGGHRTASAEQGIMKACVLERHGRNGNIGKGFVKGFGALRGAIAGSVGHDSHNLTVVGGNDRDMAIAANRLIELQGGYVVVADGRPLAELPLPIAGLMSDRDLSFVSERLRLLRAAARDIGCELEEPLLQLAFLPLPVIPHLKLTDMGYVAATPEGLALLPI